MITFRKACPKLAGLAALALVASSALTPNGASAQSAPSQQPPSPNGKIVFQSDQAGDVGVYEIYTMDADGRHETRLTNNVAADDASPVWSPAGNQIMFVSDRRGSGYEIFLMNADGSHQRPLRSAEPVRSFGAVWSPDGTRLAYPKDGDIYVIEVVAPGGGDSTAAPVNVSAGKAAGSSDIEVDWSPDGTKLVVRNATSCGGCSDLYTVNADGSNRAQLTDGAGFDTSPRWSPNGALIAYQADRPSDPDRPSLYVINAAGGTETKLSAALGCFGAPAWSPDGSRIAFNAFVGNAIYAVNSDGTGATLLSSAEGTKYNLFWSPDGSRLAFTNGNGVGFTDIFVVNTDGTSRRESNYTRTRRADETASSWQRVAAQ